MATRVYVSFLLLVIALAAAAPAGAADESAERTCRFPNAAGSAADRLAAAPGSQTPKKKAAKNNKKKSGKKGQGKRKQGAKKKQRITLQAESASANKVVNLGTDREAEEVTFHVTISPKAPRNFERRLGVVAEQFSNSSETGDTVTFEEPSFSKPQVSGNGKRVTFTMCVDAPNDLPAGKYTASVLLEGPPSVEPAVMTVTLNAKNGGIFFWLSLATAVIAAFVLLYKSAGEKRNRCLAEAAKKPAGNERETALKKAKSWRDPLSECLGDLGWWVPTIAAVGGAFTALYAAYAANPAWGEGGVVPSAIALIGTGLAAIGAKTVFTQGPPND
jgi:heme exporter protein D